MTDETFYRFSIIPGWIVDDPRLKGKDLQVLCLLGRHTNRTDGWCRRSQVKMAEQLRCSRSTVQAALNRLVEMGAIEQRVVASPDGRDSAHRYRVIYDHERGCVANTAWDDDDSQDDIPMNDIEVGTPPAGIPAPPAGPESAPPAGPESAPPAGPESAPINDSSLTPLPNETLGRAAGAEGREEDQCYDRKKVSALFDRWQKGWPGEGSLDFARNAWFALTPEERAECIRLTPAFVAAHRKSELRPPAVYLKNREWRSLPPQADSLATARGPVRPEGWAASFSPEHAAAYFRILLRGPDNPDIAPQNGIWLRVHAEKAWPRLFHFWQQSDIKGGLALGAIDRRAGELMEFVPAGTPALDAWRELFRQRGWPEPRVMSSGAYFPQGGPMGLAEFERAVRSILEAKGDDDAA